MRLVCFPWAGGSSAIYAPWLDHPGLLSVFDSIECIDYPGRGKKADEKPIENTQALVESILEGNSCFCRGEGPIVLFGHSFGATIAFEVAQQLEKRGGPRPHMVLVSAMSPPSKSRSTECYVSRLSPEGICDYFSSKGGPIDEELVNTPEFFYPFLVNVRADYSCLETYQGTTSKIHAPIAVFGGDMDQVVSLDDLSSWGENSASAPGGQLSVKVFQGQGHFFLKDRKVLSELGDQITKLMQGEVSFDEEHDAMVEIVKDAFAKVLGVNKETLLYSSDFFELGGSSLDTIALISYIESIVGIQGKM